MEDRATSKEIRKLIRKAISEYNIKEVAGIREFINCKLGKPYSSGQLSGCFTNMCKSGELVNETRGSYRIGPEFERRASYYNTPKFIYEGTLPIVEEKKQDVLGERFEKIKAEVGATLKEAADVSMKKISEIKLGEVGVNDFEFLQELNQLDEAIRSFCQKYRI